jgi:hypothetical protein
MVVFEVHNHKKFLRGITVAYHNENAFLARVQSSKIGAKLIAKPTPFQRLVENTSFTQPLPE